MLDFKENYSYLCSAGLNNPAGNFAVQSDVLRVFEFYPEPSSERRLHSPGRRGFSLYSTLYVPALRSVTVSERHINPTGRAVRRFRSYTLALYRHSIKSGFAVAGSAPVRETKSVSGSRSPTFPVVGYTQWDTLPRVFTQKLPAV